MKIKLFGKDKKKKNTVETSGGTLSDKSKFAIVESYKSARTNIMFSLSAVDKKIFAVILICISQFWKKFFDKNFLSVKIFLR